MRRLFGYLATVLVIVLLTLLLHPSSNAFGLYWCASFWLLLLSEIRWTKSKFSVDRFIGYIFAAPFIWPARLYELTRKNDCGCKH